MQLTAETFGKLQSRLDNLASQAAEPLREQVLSSSALRAPVKVRLLLYAWSSLVWLQFHQVFSKP